jgi:hypothetical protein
VLVVCFFFASLVGCTATVADTEEGGAGGGDDVNCDVDHDGHSAVGCDDDSSRPQDDCDDYNNRRFPGAPEICNGIDDDCDGNVDEGDICGGNPPPTDSDSDGDPNSTDCAPQDSSRHHGAPEICNNLDDDCNGSVDEGDVCGGGDGGSGGGGNTPASVQLYAHYRAGLDIDQPVWVKGYLSGAGSSDGYKECLMNLWGVEGASEVWICPFTFPAGSTFEFWPETLQVSNVPLYVFDVCDYPGATQCKGKGDFCAEMYGSSNADFWWTKGGPEGTVVDYSYVDNNDPEGSCTRNGKFTVPQP